MLQSRAGEQRARFLLVVADTDHDATRALVDELDRHHVDTEVCHSAADALLAAGAMQPDAVLVAANLRDLPSAEVVRVLCRRAGVHVVVGIGDEDGAAAAAVLTAGATACVARPYRAPELLPLLRAIRPDTGGVLDPPIDCGALHLDPATLEVRLHGRPIRLPLREFQLLRYFMNNVDRVTTREQIYETVWGAEPPEASNTLSVHIRRLRARLGDDQRDPKIILTVRGIGYRLVPPGTSS